MTETPKKRRIAIACQGGGSHTAFTAGVLKKILDLKEEPFEIVALSGTSGGAICALLAWYGLLLGNKARSIELLDAFWRDNSANSFWEIYLNNSLVWTSRLSSRLSLPELSPYFYPNWGQQYLKKLLQKHVSFKQIKELWQDSSPQLFIGAVNVLSGQFKVFQNAEITVEAILASTAIPSLFRAVRIGQDLFWDGLFSQNPPLRELTDAKPDEIWVIQLNPPQRQREPILVEEIRDRRNELGGNLSLEQEIHFIEKINELLRTEHLLGSKYKLIAVKRIILQRDLDYSSKLDRSPCFIQKTIADGEMAAEKFLQSV